MANGDMNLSDVAIRLIITRNTLARRLVRLGITPSRMGPCKVLSADQFHILEADHRVWRRGKQTRKRKST